jgi:4-amino-4-deoxy-L-arabinose transferase-like glycosyltransferase
MALAWWLPGVLLVAHWRLSDLDLPEAAVLALGVGLCWMLSGALLVHWLPGPMELWYLVAVYEFGALVLVVLLLGHRPLPLQPTSASTWLWLVAVLLLAVLLRLPGLGYHELHGDEMTVLHFAQAAIEGADNILLRHAKGPGEIVVTMVAYLGMGTANEASARLPFALLGVGGVLATALLGRRLFSPTVGFWAGVLLALNGFALGLSRIVQYQPVVVLLSVLALLCAWEFAQQGEGRWLALAILVCGFGVLMHYEFALLAPALLVLAWVGWRRAADRRRILALALVVGLLVAVAVVAIYLPGMLNPRFARTQRYLGSRLGGLGAFSIPIFVELGTFYNGTYFFVGLILLVVIGLALGWCKARRRTLLLALWFLPFFILHLFVMQDPGTHFYLLMPSWSLLAALPLAAVTESRPIRPWLRWGVLGALTVWLLVSAGYLYLTFFR